MIICKLHFERCICLNVWTHCYRDNAINWIAYFASSEFMVYNLAYLYKIHFKSAWQLFGTGIYNITVFKSSQQHCSLLSATEDLILCVLHKYKSLIFIILGLCSWSKDTSLGLVRAVILIRT